MPMRQSHRLAEGVLACSSQFLGAWWSMAGSSARSILTFGCAPSKLLESLVPVDFETNVLTGKMRNEP